MDSENDVDVELGKSFSHNIKIWNKGMDFINIMIIKSINYSTELASPDGDAEG